MHRFSFFRTPCSPASTICAALLLAGVNTASAQQPDLQQQDLDRAIQFGANVETVLIDFTVADDDGNFVHNLTVDDFRVYEEGEEMEITFFALEKFASLEDHVGDPRVDGAPPLSRYIVVYIDGLNTNPQDWLRIRPHLVEWFEQDLQPNDYVLLASLHPNRQMRMTSEFTRDSSTLVNALMQVEGNPELQFRTVRQERELADALGLEAVARVEVFADAARLRQGAQLATTYANERRREVRFAIDYLAGLADHLGVTFQVPGPKVVVMVSGGLPEIPGLNFRLMVDAQASETSPQVRQLAGLSTFQPMVPERSSDEGAELDLIDAIGRFNRANYLFYTIDARALGGSAGGEARSAGRVLLSPTSKATVASNERFGLLRIADGTGGLAFYNSANFDGALARVQQDTAYRYVLGYSLPGHTDEETEDGKFFRVEVETRVPDVIVRAREGYVGTGR